MSYGIFSTKAFRKKSLFFNYRLSARRARSGQYLGWPLTNPAHSTHRTRLGEVYICCGTTRPKQKLSEKRFLHGLNQCLRRRWEIPSTEGRSLGLRRTKRALTGWGHFSPKLLRTRNCFKISAWKTFSRFRRLLRPGWTKTIQRLKTRSTDPFLSSSNSLSQICGLGEARFGRVWSDGWFWTRFCCRKKAWLSKTKDTG